MNNLTSVKAFWLSFLISGAAVPLGSIAAIAQVQDSSTPEVALEASAVPAATADAAQAAASIEMPQLAETNSADTNSAVDRTLPQTDTDAATVDRTLPQTDTDAATVDRT
ncbi:porin, partial [Microcoleus sp. herbarium8]